MLDTKIMMNPDKYGYVVCSNCNGYGSSLKEESDKCTSCGGSGLVKKDSMEFHNMNKKQLKKLSNAMESGEIIHLNKKKVE